MSIENKIRNIFTKSKEDINQNNESKWESWEEKEILEIPFRRIKN